MATNILDAIKAGNDEVMQQMVQENAAVLTFSDEAGNNALHWAAMHNKVDAIRFLVGQGADINSKNNAKATPLFFAANAGNVEAVECLIKLDAVLDEYNEHKATPLFIAAREGHEPAVKLLLEAGADPHISNCNSVTPHDIAQHRDHRMVAMLINTYARARKSDRSDDVIQNILRRKEEG